MSAFRRRFVLAARHTFGRKNCRLSLRPQPPSGAQNSSEICIGHHSRDAARLLKNAGWMGDGLRWRRCARAGESQWGIREPFPPASAFGSCRPSVAGLAGFGSQRRRIRGRANGKSENGANYSPGKLTIDGRARDPILLSHWPAFAAFSPWLRMRL
jgi:hypothetical protein